MTNESLEILKRLYAVSASGTWEDRQLAADALTYIGMLEHSVRTRNGPADFGHTLLLLGQLTGALAAPENQAGLIEAMTSGSRIVDYVHTLHQRIGQLLRDAGADAPHWREP